MVKGLDKVKNLEKLINDVTRNVFTNSFMKKLGDSLVEDIKIRTRLGFGSSSIDGQRKALKPLSSSYIEFRRGNVSFFKDDRGRTRPIPSKKKSKRHPQLNPETNPTKSNLTFTGQLLDSMTAKVISNKKFEIDFPGIHKNLSKNSKRLTNNRLAEIVEENGRPFVNPTNREIQRMEKLISNALEKEINKLLSQYK